MEEFVEYYDDEEDEEEEPYTYTVTTTHLLKYGGACYAKSGKAISNLDLAGQAKIRGRIYEVVSISSYIEKQLPYLPSLTY